MISVIIPTHNRPQMLHEAIVSVLGQTVQDFELIVVDDGSTEDLNECRSLVEKSDQKWIRSINQGVSAARNLGVKHSKGKYLAFLDSDDYWRPKKLELQSQYLKKNSHYRICQTEEVWYRNSKFVNPCKYHSKPWGDVFTASLALCTISPSAVMMERELFEEVGGFDEDLKVCEDYDLWLRIASKYQVGLVEDRLVCKRGGHSDQLSHAMPAMDRFRVYSMLKILGKDCLKDDQAVEVKKMLIAKIDILLNGAQKRQSTMLPFWQNLRDSIGNELDRAQWKSLFEQSREILIARLE